jgi:hypothetical protein
MKSRMQKWNVYKEEDPALAFIEEYAVKSPLNLRLLISVMLVIGLSMFWFSASAQTSLTETNAALSATPEPSLPPKADTRIGLDLTGLDAKTALEKMSLCTKYHMGAVRITLDWNTVQPEPGCAAFDFRPYDKIVQQALAQHLEVFFVLGPTAQWASGAPATEDPKTRSAKMPKDWSQWQVYVQSAVNNYKGKVKYWQIWEGFDFGHFRASSNQIAILAENTWKTAKQADPNCRLILPEPGGIDLGWIEWLRATPTWGYFDILGLRPYSKSPDALMIPLAVLRSEVMKDHAKPIMITGWTKGLGPTQEADSTEEQQKLRSVVTSVGVKCTFEAPAADIRPVAELQQLDLTCRNAVLSSRKITYPDRVVFDINDSAVEQGLHNTCYRNWPGGRVAEEERFGKKTMVARTLHEPLNANNRDKDNPWFYFDIDDGFLYFTRAQMPVAVTIECLGTNGPLMSGFNIYYDAGRSFRFSPWQWIDSGQDKIFKYRVVLSDAWFANKDGYDFRINTKGSKENVCITRVTVEPLQTAE